MEQPKMSLEMQQADDLMNALADQRNAALNQAAQIGAQLRAAGRRIAELEAQVAELKAKLPPAPANGLDESEKTAP